ncbi:hypothetical protein EDD18DRAFT_1080139, partial [Armillaria luteobubalina]
NPLASFSSHIDDYVAESLRHEGQGDAISQPYCGGTGCENSDFTYCCVTCQDVRLFCKSCIVMTHWNSPTHIVQHWNGKYFNKIPLCKLSLPYQVRHLLGDICPHPQPVFGTHFMIIDTNSVHDVTLIFCSCSHEHLLAIQLQRAWLFLGTVIEPCMAVTMAALEQFQMLMFMGKLSAYKYYHSLAQLSDNTGTSTPSVCRVLSIYDAFIHIVWEWSFIHLLKQAGIGNNAGGWKAAELVSCTVDCLACPCPGVNIPILRLILFNRLDAWEDTLFISMDANFKLERFEVSSEEKDPSLGSGLGYFVDTTSFKNHLKITCNDHEAAKPDKTCAQSRALAASGVGGVICTCHELKLVLCTELFNIRQVKMDYRYLTAVRRFNGIPCIMMSYNITCQWSINLEDR